MKRLMTTLLVLTSLMACVNADYALFIPIKTTRYELPDNRIPEGYFEEIRLQTTDGVSLAAFWIHQEEEAHGTILYLHGQGGNLDYFWDWMSVFWEDGFNVLAIDYRGFGKSEGAPTEAGLYEDATTAFTYILNEKEVPREEIIIWGYSMGSGVATYLAASNLAGMLVLEAPFTSMVDMIEMTSPYGVPADWVSDVKFDNLSRIDRIHMPLLSIHGEADLRIPYWMGEKVFSKAVDPKIFISVPDAGHQKSYINAHLEVKEAILDSLP